MGAGGRRFESSRPDHLKQGLSGFPLGPFLLWVTLWVTNKGQIGLNLSLSVIEQSRCLPLKGGEKIFIPEVKYPNEY